MKFISTRNESRSVSFHDALLHGLAPDGGLYVPTTFPHFKPELIQHSYSDSLPELGMRIMQEFVSEIPAVDLAHLIKNTLNFPIPLVPLENNLYLLEVFHGPTLAFKDVGARFMANTLSYFLTNEKKHLNIIVATSGDTGSAIGNAFHLMPNIDVYILYPSNKITLLQEQQITTLGDNIHAIEVKGTFDDCQFLVKSALLHADFKKNHLITTANSINVARLLPQMIYHAYGICQLRRFHVDTAPILSVPSGNFGNLTSALYAYLLGYEVKHFIAATNINAIVPHYLKTGQFEPQPSKHSLSNAMDVGNPSNFERLLATMVSENSTIRERLSGTSISDETTINEIRETYQRTGYILDPHTAVGVAAARQYHDGETPIIITATAHPAKFPEVIKQAIGIEAEPPLSLQHAMAGTKHAVLMDANMDALKKIILNQ